MPRTPQPAFFLFLCWSLPVVKELTVWAASRLNLPKHLLGKSSPSEFSGHHHLLTSGTPEPALAQRFVVGRSKQAAFRHPAMPPQRSLGLLSPTGQSFKA